MLSSPNALRFMASINMAFVPTKTEVKPSRQCFQYRSILGRRAILAEVILHIDGICWLKPLHSPKCGLCRLRCDTPLGSHRWLLERKPVFRMPFVHATKIFPFLGRLALISGLYPLLSTTWRTYPFSSCPWHFVHRIESHVECVGIAERAPSLLAIEHLGC